MNENIRRPARQFALCAGAGFILTFTLCLMLRPAAPAPVKVSKPALPVKTGAAALQRRAHQEIRDMTAALEQKRAAGAASNPEEILAFAAAAGGLGNEETAKLLEELDARPAESRELARALLIRWSERDPGAAALWMLAGMENGEKSLRFTEALKTWAARDAAGFREWYVRNAPQQERVRYYAHVFMTALAGVDAIEGAKLWESAGFDRNQSGGLEMSRWAQTVRDIRPVVELALGKSGFHLKPEGEGAQAERKRLETLGGWRELFKAAAARWNEVEPAAFEEWLNTQPEPVREKGRDAVDSFGGRRPAPADYPAPEPPPPNALSDPEAVPAAEDFPALRREWAKWRQSDPQAADAFLKECAWPEEQKFRAGTAAFLPSPP